MIRILIKAKGCDPNLGDFEKNRTVDIESKELEKALIESFGHAWVIGAEVIKKEKEKS